MDWYRDRTVLITGASSGIGEAMARRIAPAGATLLLTARSEEALERLAAELREAGSEAYVFPHDLGTAGAAHALHERITAAGHSVDVLVNNAGFGRQGDVIDVEATVWEEMLALKVLNLVTLSRLFLPAMVERGHGGVLNMSSTSAFQPLPRFAVYAASNTFVKRFSEALHVEVAGAGVHVTCLCPGAADTPSFYARANMKRPATLSPLLPTTEIARVGLEALAKNRRLEVIGVTNKILALGAKLAPTWLSLKVGHRVVKASG